MADPDLDSGFVFYQDGLTDIQRSTFFDPITEIVESGEEYINRISFDLAQAIEEHLPTGTWILRGRSPSPSTPATFPTTKVLGYLFLVAKHKIQSAAGPLDMRLTQVPKMLRILRTDWAPSAFCVSFKLETDSEILLQKAESALRKYQMHVVVANELATYKREVIAVTLDGKISIRKQSEDADVEEQLIKLLVEKHNKYIECCGMG